MYILITYDVDTTTPSGAKRLRQVAKACKDYGQREQNSVFECQLSDAQLTLLKDRISAIIDTSLDSIRIYLLNRQCEKTIVIGRPTAFDFNSSLII